LWLRPSCGSQSLIAYAQNSADADAQVAGNAPDTGLGGQRSTYRSRLSSIGVLDVPAPELGHFLTSASKAAHHTFAVANAK
jgi:hypothetical protein